MFSEYVWKGEYEKPKIKTSKQINTSATPLEISWMNLFNFIIWPMRRIPLLTAHRKSCPGASKWFRFFDFMVTVLFFVNFLVIDWILFEMPEKNSVNSGMLLFSVIKSYAKTTKWQTFSAISDERQQYLSLKKNPAWSGHNSGRHVCTSMETERSQ